MVFGFQFSGKGKLFHRGTKGIEKKPPI